MFRPSRSKLLRCIVPAVTLAAAVSVHSLLYARPATTAPRAPYDPGVKVFKPRIFAPGVISTDLDESGGSFSPDGRDFYFTLLAPYTTNPHLGVICVSHFEAGAWQEPQVLSFSGKSLDFGPRVSPDGTRLYFASARPVPNAKQPHFRIWVSQRTGDTWGDPAPAASPINGEDSDNVDPAIASNGDFYFASNRGDPAGHLHIFVARRASPQNAGQDSAVAQYLEPEKLGPEINSDFTEASPAVSPDGKLLVFASTAAPEDSDRRRPQDLIAAGKPYPRQDLYISSNQGGHWTPARHLGHGINSSAEEVYPAFSPDGKFLFWGSERSAFEIPTQRLHRAQIEKLWRGRLNGRGNIYFISVDALTDELEVQP